MSAFESIRKKISAAADVTYGGAERLTEIAKVRYMLSAATRRADAAYEKLGKKYYEHMKAQSDTEENSDDLFTYKADEADICKEISEASEEIARLDALLREAEQKNICPTCGALVGKHAENCRRCGASVKR